MLAYQTYRKYTVQGLQRLYSVLLVLFLTSPCASKNMYLGGSMTTDATIAHFYMKNESDSFTYQGKSFCEFLLKSTDHSRYKFEAITDITIPYGVLSYNQNSSDSLSSPGIVSTNKQRFFLDFRTLYASLFFKYADLSIGRQIVNFGNGTVFSPIDIFSTIMLTDIKFKRHGSDRVALKIPFSALSGCDILVGFPDAVKSYSAAVKLFTTIATADMSIIGIAHKPGSSFKDFEYYTFGYTLKGDAIVGIYGEVLGTYIPYTRNTHMETMIGADYSLRNMFFFQSEFLYRSQKDPLNFKGKYNCYASLRYQITDLMNMFVYSITDVTHHATLGSAGLSYSLLQNTLLQSFINAFDSYDGFILQYVSSLEIKF